MLANVRYRGLAVAQGARISRTEGEGEDPIEPFIELDSPFPVGTALAVELVREGEVESRTVRVRQVHEGQPAGIFVQFTDGAAIPTDLPSRAPATRAAVAAPPARATEPPPKGPTEIVPLAAQNSSDVDAVDAHDTAPSMPAVNIDSLSEARDTAEMAVISIEAEAEDETIPKPSDGRSDDSKGDDNRRGGGKKRKRSKTVMGH